MERFRLTILAESRIRWKVYVRFGGEYWETYHRNMTRRRVLSLHNQVVKVVNSHFSNVAIPHQIAALEQRTRELKALSMEILNLAKQAKEWLRGSSPGGALYYNKEKVDKDEAEVLLWQKMLEPFDKHGRLDIDACMDSFWPYLEANRRTANTVFHVSLDPSPEDKLTDEQLGKIACEYMERMGYGKQPYIVFKHKDISREHLHIVSLRVDEQGRKLPHDFEARRSMEILRDLERKYGLHPSVKGEEQADKVGLHRVNYREGNVKQQISSVVRSCLRNYKCSSYGEFCTLLELFNVSVEERTGTIDGRNYAGSVSGSDRRRLRHRHAIQVESYRKGCRL